MEFSSAEFRHFYLDFHVRVPPPGCVWAQRPKHIILSICLTDVKDPVIKVEKTKLYFKGVGGTENKLHEVEMEFFKEIDVDVSCNVNRQHGSTQ